jgi:hypothetical protein
MPLTEITRAHYVREGLHYASDLSDPEWGQRSDRGMLQGGRLRFVLDVTQDYCRRSGRRW